MVLFQKRAYRTEEDKRIYALFPTMHAWHETVRGRHLSILDRSQKSEERTRTHSHGRINSRRPASQGMLGLPVPILVP
jgi:hypothetical protein